MLVYFHLLEQTKGQEGEGEGEWYLSLVHSPNASSSQGEVRPKSVDWNYSAVSHIGGRATTI